MATISKRGHTYHVQIRRTGHPTLTRTFDRKDDALEWARDKEREIDRGTLPETLEAKRTTLATAMDDYRQHVTPKHKGAATENRRLRGDG